MLPDAEGKRGMVGWRSPVPLRDPPAPARPCPQGARNKHAVVSTRSARHAARSLARPGRPAPHHPRRRPSPRRTMVHPSRAWRRARAGELYRPPRPPRGAHRGLRLRSRPRRRARAPRGLVPPSGRRRARTGGRVRRWRSTALERPDRFARRLRAHHDGAGPHGALADGCARSSGTRERGSPRCSPASGEHGAPSIDEPRRASPERPRLLAGLGAQVLFGATKSPPPGLAVQLGVRWQYFSVSAEGSGIAPAATGTVTAANVSTMTLGAVPCFHLGIAVGCGVLAFGRLGASTPSRADRPDRTMGAYPSHGSALPS